MFARNSNKQNMESSCIIFIYIENNNEIVLMITFRLKGLRTFYILENPTFQIKLSSFSSFNSMEKWNKQQTDWFKYDLVYVFRAKYSKNCAESNSKLILNKNNSDSNQTCFYFNRWEYLDSIFVSIWIKYWNTK